MTNHRNHRNHRIAVKYINDNREMFTPWVAGSADVRRHFLPGEFIGTSVGNAPSHREAVNAAMAGIPKGCRYITEGEYLELLRGRGHRSAARHDSENCAGCKSVAPKFRKKSRQAGE